MTTHLCTGYLSQFELHDTSSTFNVKLLHPVEHAASQTKCQYLRGPVQYEARAALWPSIIG